MNKLILITVCLLFQNLIAQTDSLSIKDEKYKVISPEWIQKNKVGIDLSEVTFVNWNAGGSNSISALLGLESSANYIDKYFFWNNNVELRYGLNKQQGKEIQKTDDLIEITSNLGYRPDSLSNWFYSSRLNFKTQIANGYKYPETAKPLSRFMAPGYLFFGGGIEYGKQIEKLSFYFSPVTLKTTFVLDDDLANAGSFGVISAVLDEEGNVIVEGEKVRTEVGILMTNSYEKEIAENITVKNLISFYTDYINNFGNFDVDWQVNFDFKVNSFVRATLESHLKYDDDVKTSEATDVEGEFDEAGAKVQWKQFLGIGFAVDF